MNKTIIETINLKKTFDHKDGKIDLFKNVNLKVKKGDLIALVGPSGSGKSSFLHLLALLDEPTQGKILLNNKNIKNFTEEEKDTIRREKISIIFQDNNLLSDFTALENITMPLIIRGEKTSLAYKKGEKILKEVKILNRANHFPNEMSGGEQQRIAIARALYRDCQFLVLDEATSALDQNVEEKILKSLNKIKQDKTLMMVSHKRSTLQFCNKILKIDLNGEVKICKYQDVE